MNMHHLARTLGGEVSGRNTISIPTPGHSRRDRGTTITCDPAAPGGLLVHSFNGGDPLQIKDMVRRALGMPDWEPGMGRTGESGPIASRHGIEPPSTATRTKHTLGQRKSGSGSIGRRRSGTRQPIRAARWR